MQTKDLITTQLTTQIKKLGLQCGFHAIGITLANISSTAQKNYQQWIDNNYNANMHFMQRTTNQRLNPQLFVPEVKSVICCRWDRYLNNALGNKNLVAYAQVSDYHIEIQQRLEQFASLIQDFILKNTFYVHHNNNLNKDDILLKCFCDTKPVLEKYLAMQAGLGWIGKNSLLINKFSGSSCFLGEIYTNLELIYDKPEFDLCGNCRKCLDYCPTQAITNLRMINTNRCIAYLTLVHKGSIPLELRKAIGTQVIGCDLCQKCCPWNQYKKSNLATSNINLYIKNILCNISLAEMLLLNKNDYKNLIANTPLDGYLTYEKWLRNVAIALGNSPKSDKNINALNFKLTQNISELVNEHIVWALNENL